MTTHTRPDPELPDYARITADLREGITSGAYPPGSLMPSTAEIQANYRVSSTTARHVLTQLVQEGLCRSERRRGLFVLRTRTRRTLPSRRYNPSDGPVGHDDTETGTHPHVTHELPPDDVALVLQLDADAPVIHRQTLHTDPRDRQPHELRHRYIPAHHATSTPLADTQPLTQPWRHTVETHLNTTYRTVTTHTTARLPREDEAHTLKTSTSTPLLVTDTVTYTQDGRPIDLTRCIWPADATRLADYYTC